MMITGISDFDHFLKKTTMFLPPSFIGVLGYISLIPQLNSKFERLSLTLYRMEICGIEYELWPFSSFLKCFVNVDNEDNDDDDNDGDDDDDDDEDVADDGACHDGD